MPQVILSFSLVVAYDELEDRRTKIFPLGFKIVERFDS